MSSLAIPVIKVSVQPSFDSTGALLAFAIVFTFEVSGLDHQDVLIAKPGASSGLSVVVEDGHLTNIESSDHPSVTLEKEGLRWSQKHSRDLKLSYIITLDLISDNYRPEHGGFLGPGSSFMLIPKGDQIHRNVVEWDLSQCPEGTRAVWTFGEGPLANEQIGPGSILGDSVYMIGPIQSNPSALIPGTMSDYYGYYWFGNLPPNIAVIRDIHHEFFVKVSEYFKNLPSSANTYRSFVCSTRSVKSFGGRNYLRSHVFSYDNQISQAHDYDLIRRMAYEVIDNFVGPLHIDPQNDWLFEGIRNTLSIYLPFRFGFRTSDYFQSTLSVQCTKYYTNPLIHLTHDEALALASTNLYARELVSARAWVFVILTDFRTRVVAGATRPDLMPRPAEDLAMKPMAWKKRKGEAHGIDQWIKLLQPLMGNEARELYEQMKSGVKVILPEKFFGSATHRITTIQQEMLDFGMDRESFEGGTVKGLVVGSRAQRAGLQEGDKVARSSHTWKCVDNFEAEIEVIVEKEGVEKPIKYWPRSIEKVECFNFVKHE